MGKRLYRIIDIDSIINKYKIIDEETAEIISTEIVSNGGINNG
jgi:hypothetical protein